MSGHDFLSLIFEKSEFRKLLISQRGRAWPMSSVALWNDSRSVVWMIYNLSSCRVRHLEKNTVEAENLKKKTIFWSSNANFENFWGRIQPYPKNILKFKHLFTFNMYYLLDSTCIDYRKNYFVNFFTRKIKYWVNLLDFLWTFAEISVFNSLPW